MLGKIGEGSFAKVKLGYDSRNERYVVTLTAIMPSPLVHANH